MRAHPATSHERHRGHVLRGRTRALGAGVTTCACRTVDWLCLRQLFRCLLRRACVVVDVAFPFDARVNGNVACGLARMRPVHFEHGEGGGRRLGRGWATKVAVECPGQVRESGERKGLRLTLKLNLHYLSSTHARPGVRCSCTAASYTPTSYLAQKTYLISSPRCSRRLSSRSIDESS